MRPDDRQQGFDDLMDAGMDLPFDAALEVLDQELEESIPADPRLLESAACVAAQPARGATRRGDAGLAASRP